MQLARCQNDKKEKCLVYDGQSYLELGEWYKDIPSSVQS